MELTDHELGFIWMSINSLKYEDVSDEGEKEYNQRIDNLLKKISKIRERFE